MRRVTFSVDKLEHDPQQQIPSRRPKRGNVLIPQDINAPPPRLCLGISVNEPNNKDDGKSHNHSKYSDHEIALAEDAQRRAIIEAEKHAQEAHRQAKRLLKKFLGIDHIDSYPLKKVVVLVILTPTATTMTKMMMRLKKQLIRNWQMMFLWMDRCMSTNNISKKKLKAKQVKDHFIGNNLYKMLSFTRNFTNPSNIETIEK